MVHGSPETAEVVANYMTMQMGMKSEHIFYPDVLQTVDCSSETHIYRVCGVGLTGSNFVNCLRTVTAR